MTEQADGPAPAPQVDSRQFLLIGGLLVLAITLLAVLWARERRARIRAQTDAAGLRHRLRTMQTLDKLAIWRPELPSTSPSDEGGGANVSSSAPGLVRPVQRDDLPIETVEIDGRRTKVLRIGAAAGTRVGFRPGDLVVVAEGGSATSVPAENAP